MQHNSILHASLSLALLTLPGCPSSKRDTSTSNKVDEPAMQATPPPTTAPPPRGRPTPMGGPARTRATPPRVVTPVDKPKLIPFKKRKDGALLVSLRLPANAKISKVNRVVFTPDGKHLLVAAGRRYLQMWTLSKTAVKQVYETTVNGTIYELVVSPDGRWLALTGSRRIASLRSHRGRRLRSPARRARFESFLMVMDLNKRLWFLNKASEQFRFRRPSFTADAKHLVVLRTQSLSGGYAPRLGKPQSRVKDEIVAFAMGELKQAWKATLREKEHSGAAVWDTTDQVFYTSKNDVFLLNRKTGKTRKLRGRHRAGCRVTTVHHDRKLVVTVAHPAFHPHELFLWQMPGGKLKRRLYFGRREHARQATFLGKDHLIGGASRKLPSGKLKPQRDRERGILRIWSAKTGRLVKAVRGLPLEVSSVAAASTGWIVLGGQYLFKPGDYECRLLLYPPKTLIK